MSLSPQNAAVGAFGAALGGTAGGAVVNVFGGSTASMLGATAAGRVIGGAAAAGVYLYRDEIQTLIDGTIRELKNLAFEYGTKLINRLVNFVERFGRLLRGNQNMSLSLAVPQAAPQSSLQAALGLDLDDEQHARIGHKFERMFDRWDDAVEELEADI